MKALSKEVKSLKIFYGWIIVASCFFTTLTLGEAMWTFGVFFKPLENEFGWSRALVSSGYTAFLIGFGISVVASGRFADRYSPRPILLISAIAAGLGTSLCSQVYSIHQLRFFLFFGGLGAGATFSVPTSTVPRWFYRRPRAGLALGIVVSGVGVGALIFAPLTNFLIFTYGWRNAYLAIGSLYFITIALSSLAIKQSSNESRTSLESAGRRGLKQIMSQRWTTSRILLNSSFLSLAFIHCVGNLSFQILCIHLVPHAIDAGISPATGAAALGLLGGFSIPGRIISGFISDRTKWQIIVALSCFGMALSLVTLLFLKTAWMLYCFVFFFGICHGSRISANVGILGEFFGMHSLGEVIGISGAIAQFIGAFAPYVAGYIFDSTGRYFVAFVILIILLLASSATASVLKKPVALQ